MLVSVIVAMILLIIFPSSVRAVPIIRALYPNPPGTDSNEWILVENPDDASVSANLLSLGDTQGSTKTWKVTKTLPPHSLTTFVFGTTGISLNNTGDSVIVSSASAVLDQSTPYVDAQDGMVWWKSNSGWLYSPEADFLVRLESRNWELPVPEVEESNAEDTEKSTSNQTLADVPLVSPPTSPKIRPIASVPPAPSTPTSSLKPLILPTLQSSATASATAAKPFPTAPPIPDPDEEVRVFMAWQKQALLGSLGLIFAGMCCWILVLPDLIRSYLAFDDW